MLTIIHQHVHHRPTSDSVINSGFYCTKQRERARNYPEKGLLNLSVESSEDSAFFSARVFFFFFGRLVGAAVVVVPSVAVTVYDVVVEDTVVYGRSDVVGSVVNS